MAAEMTFHVYLYGPQQGPLTISLERAAAAMEDIPKLYFEWDGSFGWTGGAEGWQMTGTAYDNGQSLQYIDLHGRIESPESRRLMRDRLAELFALLAPASSAADAGNDNGLGDFGDAISLMRLPVQQWQDLHDFERELLGKP